MPYDPERIAVLDMASLDILDNLDLGDRVVGSATTSLDYLTDYVDNDKVTNLEQSKRRIWKRSWSVTRMLSLLADAGFLL